MDHKRAIERYKDHEVVCVAVPESTGWHYTVSIVSHEGDKSEVHSEKSVEKFRSDTAALQAATSHARRLIDDMVTS